MRESTFFKSYGTVVVGVKFKQTSDKTAQFQIVEAIDYPMIDVEASGEETADLRYFNFIGEGSEVADRFEDANLIASGTFIVQYPEDMNYPIKNTIEFQNGVVWDDNEFENFYYILTQVREEAFNFIMGSNLYELDRVKVDFSTV